MIDEPASCEECPFVCLYEWPGGEGETEACGFDPEGWSGYGRGSRPVHYDDGEIVIEKLHCPWRNIDRRMVLTWIADYGEDDLVNEWIAEHPEVMSDDRN